VIPGLRALGALLLAASVSAPIQCGSKPRPELRMEEEPAEALYKLAERFAAQGDKKARIDTLRFIVERYPTSRFAQAAKLDLEQLGGASP
jgi:outer membrane protein assembly factor BamD (BamD/ComL family)